MNSKQWIIQTIIALAFIVHGSSGYGHGDHVPSVAMALSENPVILKHIDEFGKVEAWYDPTPVGKRSDVVLKVYDQMNALHPERLQSIWIRLDDGVTSYPMKIMEDSEVANHLYVQALPTENSQDFILFLNADDGETQEVVLKGFNASEQPISMPSTAEQTLAEPLEPSSPSTLLILVSLLFFAGGAFLWLKQLRNH